ncbi:c-type cytochrome [Candidatus Nitronereus thalassa]|uniref:C-type cytochrome n=1 Tax=Candidatus Nitronereus thalassa TaxID=3020898 RepID=A0ABU3K7P4_9BACT|nr:c-type cytochrome [Candidatus Nitronereus thalassa]MDT7042382.1 c-type cytochrome [Candidatus Nitronereus thalassa]
MSMKLVIFIAVSWLQVSTLGWAQENMYPPIVPPDELMAARSLKNPFTTSQEAIDQGKTLYEGRVFCAACHGKDGTGLPSDVDPTTARYPFPRDFTDPKWQTARTDGELFWVLTEGSHGTDMASFLPMYLAEKDAWQIIMYIRTFVKFSEKL